ncbi:bifunctional 4-hydroxy-2-oxoglutarate aldolase/2-dehydro-3-deoxy-phosphogluconate aldolase [Gloeocapsa sp. PCC 73106]|uniref:bifunctional 4-hydroxy-2-oxoglutarate aldolase/2-dehydro-3-deoxy-phosphogluconate aldolase n=1 Tax=Gloeocapsa sp. PCC 73106 TaxID=102232 RepID=UPI0002ACC7A6|nr:bifunctional 4-hydroxy-2-oxoglutarate aldolase/2-dehydro-3-deoxy-phosphogluconate aldolase [Gloeocapsa sp. PCC 73106]ELR96363.1 Entner-Doudoroff aldolase [Gloeocapsa sp. PCC 73106]
MQKETWLKLLSQYRAIAVIRSPDLTLGIHMATAVAQGGMNLLEITWNSDEPAQLLRELKTRLSHCVIGVGTILTLKQLEEAIASGAQFCFSPHYDPQLLQLSQEAQIPLIPGALSPTEILKAWHDGASSVKVFPVDAMGGVKYIQSLQGPLDGIPLIPTGGVTLENAATFIKSGAIAVGLAKELFPQALVVTKNWQAIALRTQLLCDTLKPLSVKIN